MKSSNRLISNKWIAPAFMILQTTCLAEPVIEVVPLASDEYLLKFEERLTFAGQLGFDERTSLVIDDVAPLPARQVRTGTGISSNLFSENEVFEILLGSSGGATSEAGSVDQGDLIFRELGDRQILEEISHSGQSSIFLRIPRLFLPDQLAGTKTIFLQRGATKTEPLRVNFVLKPATDLHEGAQLEIVSVRKDGLTILECSGNSHDLRVEYSSDCQSWKPSGFSPPSQENIRLSLFPQSSLQTVPQLEPHQLPKTVFWRLSPGPTGFRSENQVQELISISGLSMTMGVDSTGRYYFKPDGTGLLVSEGSIRTFRGSYPFTWTEEARVGLSQVSIELSDGSIEEHVLQGYQPAGSPASALTYSGFFTHQGGSLLSASFSSSEPVTKVFAIGDTIVPASSSIPDTLSGRSWLVEGAYWSTDETTTQMRWDFVSENTVTIRDSLSSPETRRTYQTRPLGLDVLEITMSDPNGPVASYRVHLNPRSGSIATIRGLVEEGGNQQIYVGRVFDLETGTPQ